MRKLFKAKIYHKRFIPKVNEFVNSGFYIRFDIDKMNTLNSLLFKVNKFGLFSFYVRDHGYRNEDSLNSWAMEQLAKVNIKDIDRIELQTFPRVFGYVFNPVSFWFCYQGNDIVAVINEVNNTFGQSHIYIVKNTKLKLPKEFHVSPFLDVKGIYEFNYAKSNSVQIDYYDEGELKLKTLISGNEIEWSNKNFLKLFVKNPFFTFAVVAHIHYQALKLYLKKIKFYKLPDKPIKDITYEWRN